LRKILTSYRQHAKAMEMFLQQHAMLHSSKMVGDQPWSFDDEILDDLTDAQFRKIPPGSEHSIVWCIWHITRIEDITINMLVAGGRQLFEQDGWYERLQVRAHDTGNAMSPDEIAELSASVECQALRAYRLAVGRRTRQIVAPLRVEDIKVKVDPARLEQVLAAGAVVPEAQGLIDYWGGRTIAGLLLMPASRHILVHLNECLRIKGKLSK
jgi:hypothetical protein